MFMLEGKYVALKSLQYGLSPTCTVFTLVEVLLKSNCAQIGIEYTSSQMYNYLYTRLPS